MEKHPLGSPKVTGPSEQGPAPPEGGPFAVTCPRSPQHLCPKTLAAALAAPVPVHQRPWGQKWPGAAGRTTSTHCHMRRERCRAGAREAKAFPLLSSCSCRPAEQLAPMARQQAVGMSGTAAGCWKAGVAARSLLRVPVASGPGFSTGFVWDTVNFLFSSWYSAVFWI